MKVLHMIAFGLLVVGGLNWGIWGATNMQTNVVHSALGSLGPVEMIVYILVGLSAIYEAACHKKNCKCCDNANSGMMNRPTTPAM